MGGLFGRFPAWRAAIRLARRDAWRNKGRSALIAVMIALPVFAAGAVSVLYRSDARDPQDLVQITLGTQAQASVSIGNGQAMQQSIDGQDSASIGDSDGQDSAQPPTVAKFRAGVQAVISPRDRLVTDTQSWAGRGIRFQDRLLTTSIREVDYATPGLGGLVKQIAGRAPTGPDELVVSQNLAQKKKIRVGDELSYTPSRDQPAKNLTVVGIVGGPSLIGTPTVIGQPGSLIPASDLSPDAVANQGEYTQTLLVAGPDPVTWDQVLDLNQLGSLVLSRSVINNPPPSDRVPFSQQNYASSVQAGAVGIGVVVIGLVLLQIALLAGPAIAVGARRNQRSLAIMSATGADRRHLRAVVLATSGVIGLVASALAALLGAGVGAVTVLVLRDHFDQQIVRVDISPLDLIGLALIGGLTAVAAALIPARQAARLDVVAALTGRRGQSAPRLRVPVAGLLVALVGVGLAFFTAQRNQPFYTVTGLALAEIGLVAAAGAIVALAARLAVRLPFSPRFALRDAARQRGRTAPAVAAVLAAIAGGTAALVYVSAQAQHDREAYVPSSPLGTVTVQASDDSDPKDLPAVEAALRRTLPIDRVATFQGVVNSYEAGWISLTPTLPPQNECPGTDAKVLTEALRKVLTTDPRCLGTATKPGMVGFQGNDLFDDGSAVTLLTGNSDPANASALKAGRVLVSDPLMLWPDGTVHVSIDQESPTDPNENKARTVTLPARLSTGTTRLIGPVYPISAIKALGVPVHPMGLVAGTTRMPTSDEEDRAKAAAQDTAQASLNVERGYHNDYALGLLALVAAAALVTLGGTFTAVGLAAAEGKADIATLAAVGASPGVRRRLAASQAGVVAGLGSVLGVASGVLAGWILVRMQIDDFGSQAFQGIDQPGVRWEFVVPWIHLLAIGLGVPLLAVAVGFLSARSRLPMVRRLAQ